MFLGINMFEFIHNLWSSRIDFVLNYLRDSPDSIWEIYESKGQENHKDLTYRTKDKIGTLLMDNETLLQISYTRQYDHIEFRLATWKQINKNGVMGDPADMFDSPWRQITNIGQFLLAMHNKGGDDDYYHDHKSEFRHLLAHSFRHKPTHEELAKYGVMYNPNELLTPSNKSNQHSLDSVIRQLNQQSS